MTRSEIPTGGRGGEAWCVIERRGRGGKKKKKSKKNSSAMWGAEGQCSFERAAGLDAAGVWDQWLAPDALVTVREHLRSSDAWRAFITGELPAAPPDTEEEEDEDEDGEEERTTTTTATTTPVARANGGGGGGGGGGDGGGRANRQKASTSSQATKPLSSPLSSTRRGRRSSTGKGSRGSHLAAAAASAAAEEDAEGAGGDEEAVEDARQQRQGDDDEVEHRRHHHRPRRPRSRQYGRRAEEAKRLASLAPLRLKVRALLFDPSLCGGDAGCGGEGGRGCDPGERGGSGGGEGKGDVVGGSVRGPPPSSFFRLPTEGFGGGGGGGGRLDPRGWGALLSGHGSGWADAASRLRLPIDDVYYTLEDEMEDWERLAGKVSQNVFYFYFFCVMFVHSHDFVSFRTCKATAKKKTQCCVFCE